MRGVDHGQSAMFSYVSPEKRVPANHPLRPIREMVDGEIYRVLRYGDLADLIMLDTRITGREEQVAASDPARNDPNRQLLGAAQETWLFDTLSGSTAGVRSSIAHASSRSRTSSCRNPAP